MSYRLFNRLTKYFCILLLAVVLAGCGDKDADNTADSESAELSENGTLSSDEAGSVSSNSSNSIKQDMEITVNFPYGKRTGVYTGQTLSINDVPDGTGRFKTVGTDHITWEYSGQWVNGLPEGFGSCRWEDGAEYVGQYQNGQWNGYGEYYLNGELWFKGTFKDDKCVDIDRELANSYDPGSVQAVHWDVRGFYIPDSWSYKVKDENKVLIKTDDGTNIVLEKHPSSAWENKGEKAAIKNAFDKTYKRFGMPEMTGENSGSMYELAYKYLDDNNVFPVEVSAYAFDKGRDCFVVTTFATDSVKDYYEDSKCIADTFSSWKRISKNAGGSGNGQDREEIMPVSLEGTKNGKEAYFHSNPVAP